LQKPLLPEYDYAIALRNMVKVRAHDDDSARTARQRTDDIGELGSFYWLLRNALAIATGLREHFFERCFALLIISGIFAQP